MHDSEFHIEGFNMYRAGRSSSNRGEGVLMYIHESHVFSVPYAQRLTVMGLRIQCGR